MMMKIFKNTFFVVILLLCISCKDDGVEIAYYKYVFKNECSSDMIIKGYRTDLSFLQYDTAMLFIHRNCDRNQVAKSMGGHGDTHTLTNEYTIIENFGLAIEIEIGDSVINMPLFSEEGRMWFSITYVHQNAWNIDFYRSDDYFERGDTAIFTYIYNDERLQKIVDFYAEEFDVYPTKRSI